MSEIVFAISALTWLFLGGWALYQLSADLDRKELGALALFCLMLAPFMAGFAWAMQREASND